MGLFTAITGQDDRDKGYLETLNYCLRKIREKADEMGVNLNDYFNTSNANSFQEESILFFLANAAITAPSSLPQPPRVTAIYAFSIYSPPSLVVTKN